jgi:hypothetical protein
VARDGGRRVARSGDGRGCSGSSTPTTLLRSGADPGSERRRRITDLGNRLRDDLRAGLDGDGNGRVSVTEWLARQQAEGLPVHEALTEFWSARDEALVGQEFPDLLQGRVR